MKSLLNCSTVLSWFRKTMLLIWIYSRRLYMCVCLEKNTLASRNFFSFCCMCSQIEIHAQVHTHIYLYIYTTRQEKENEQSAGGFSRTSRNFNAYSRLRWNVVKRKRKEGWTMHIYLILLSFHFILFPFHFLLLQRQPR